MVICPSLPSRVGAMRKVAIVTDSSACVPVQLVEEHGIRVVPIHLVFGNQVYHDGLDITPPQFYALLKQAPHLPTTSAPSPGSYLEVYRELAQQHQAILCITISARFSAINSSARLAAQMAKEILPELQIEVLDSGTAAMAQGFVVLAAARAAASGQDLAQVVAAARGVMPRVNIIAILDTLSYLAKGGRVPKIMAWVGSLLSIKPIMGMSQTNVGLLARARTKPQAVERILAIIEKRVGNAPVHLAVVHTNVPQEAEELKTRVAAMLRCVELYVTEFTPVMGAHTGPGLLGFAYYVEE